MASDLVGKYLHRLKIGLLSLLVFCSGLIGISLYSLSNDTLMSITLWLVLTYLVSFSTYKLYQSMFNSFVEITSYTNQELPETVSSFNTTEQEFNNLLAGLFNVWHLPVVIFDNDKKLRYFNHAFQLQVNLAICRGMTIQECGFSQLNNKWQHDKLKKAWKVDGFELKLNDSLLLIASNIGAQLQSAKKESQQNLIRTLSHELNNSIAPIASLADTLLTSPLISELEKTNALERIKYRSERILKFVQSYAEMSRLPAAAPQSIELQKLATVIAQEQNVNLTYLGLASVNADAMLIEQLFINLLKNAYEACEQNCTATLINEQFGNKQKLTLIDSGPGFANLDNVMTPLYTTKLKGQGLGLSICQEIVEQHGGTITLSNHEEGGAKVVIELPL